MHLGIYPRIWKLTYIYTEMCAVIFIATLFVIAPNWKQTRCLSTGVWINKLWCSCRMEYYSIKLSKVKRQPSEWEKIIANETTDKGLIPKYTSSSYNSIPEKQTTQSKSVRKT